MGLYLSVYLADWPRLAHELQQSQPRRPKHRYDYVLERAWDLLLSSAAAHWGEPDADGLRWHRDGWIAQYPFGVVNQNWETEFEWSWRTMRDCYDCTPPCPNDDCAAPKEWSDDDPALMRDAGVVLDAVSETTVAVGHDAAQRWSAADAVMERELLKALSPASVEVVADAWARISHRVEDLRPRVEPHLFDNHRIKEFGDFTRFLIRWGAVMTAARDRGLGVVYCAG